LCIVQLKDLLYFLFNLDLSNFVFSGVEMAFGNYSRLVLREGVSEVPSELTHVGTPSAARLYRGLLSDVSEELTRHNVTAPTYVGAAALLEDKLLSAQTSSARGGFETMDTEIALIQSLHKLSDTVKVKAGAESLGALIQSDNITHITTNASDNTLAFHYTKGKTSPTSPDGETARELSRALTNLFGGRKLKNNPIDLDGKLGRCERIQDLPSTSPDQGILVMRDLGPQELDGILTMNQPASTSIRQVLETKLMPINMASGLFTHSEIKNSTENASPEGALSVYVETGSREDAHALQQEIKGLGYTAERGRISGKPSYYVIVSKNEWERLTTPFDNWQDAPRPIPSHPRRASPTQVFRPTAVPA